MKDYNYCFPYAIRSNQLEIVKYIYDKFPQKELSKLNWEIFFLKCCKFKHCDQVFDFLFDSFKNILATEDFMIVIDWNRIVKISCSVGNKRIVEKILDYKVDFDSTLSLHTSFLHSHFSIFEFILQNAKSDFQKTLIFCCKKNKFEIIDFLLERGVDLDCFYNGIETLLHYAALNGIKRLLVSFLYYGANYLKPNKEVKNIFFFLLIFFFFF